MGVAFTEKTGKKLLRPILDLLRRERAIGYFADVRNWTATITPHMLVLRVTITIPTADFRNPKTLPKEMSRAPMPLVLLRRSTLKREAVRRIEAEVRRKSP